MPSTLVKLKLRNPSPLLLDGLLLLLFWIGAAIVDRLWLGLDGAVPGWDQSDHLTRALNYLRILQQADWLSGEWWTQLWRLSPGYRAPLVYLATTPFLALFGREFDQATLVNLAFSALLLVSLYALGRLLFDRRTGLWLAGCCVVLPALAMLRIDYLLDYGLVAIFVFTFACLSAWRQAKGTRQRWVVTIGLGIGLGLTFLTKTTGVLFLTIPMVWVLLETVGARKWGRLLQLGCAIGLGAAISYPWFATNWLTILTTSFSNNASWQPVGLKPGDKVGALLYYLNRLPDVVPLPLLLIALGSWMLLVGRQLWERSVSSRSCDRRTWLWLAGFLLGTYGLMTALQNKDPRHIMPAIPILVLVLIRGLVLLPARWGQVVRWGAALATLGLLLLSLFPVPGSPFAATGKFPYRGPALPHHQIVTEVAQAQPFLRSTIGVLSNTIHANPMNIDLFGAIHQFQVFGRELSLNPTFVNQDGRSLLWFITKTGEQGPENGQGEAKAAIRQWVAQSPDLQIQDQWPLPDGSQLSLYRKKSLPIEVAPVPGLTLDRVQLVQVTVPAQVLPGQPIPVTYEWLGPWEQLQNGLVELTWQNRQQPIAWLHDHGIAMGQLYSSQPPAPQQVFRVTETLAMLPANEVGTYRLQAHYLNRRTGDRSALVIPAVQLELTDQATQLPAPELDLVTQFRQFSQALAAGKLDAVFQQIGRINQYDPVQDYLLQAEQLLRDRLQQTPKDVNLAYSLALVYVLQQRVQPAIAQFQQITRLDARNPWSWTYLGFVHLYNWQPGAAAAALDQALVLDSKLETAKTLRGVAAILQFDWAKAKQLL